jgi:hypothetical protein
MSGLTKKLKPDRSKIDTHNPKELKCWTKSLNASKVEVLGHREGWQLGSVREERWCQRGEPPVRLMTFRIATLAQN